MFKFTTRLALIGATSAAVLGLLTACSAPSGGEDSSAPKQDPKGSSDTQNAEQAFTQWQSKFAQCMRDEGIDMPDPSGDGSQTMQIGGNIDMKTFEAAGQKCRDKLGEAPSRDGRSPEQVKEAMLKFAQCVRDAGYDYADPAPGGSAMEARSDIPEETMKSCATKAGLN